MRFLVDTNIFLEVLLNQQSAKEARSFLQKSDTHEFFISDFSLHSIALILLRHEAFAIMDLFLADTVQSGGVRVLGVPAGDLAEVVAASRQYGLDFDDAYQYTLAVRQDLPIISFDADFDRTPQAGKGRRKYNEPARAVRLKGISSG